MEYPRSVILNHLILFLIFLSSLSAFAAQKGKVVENGGVIYTKPDFDSKIVEEVLGGIELDMSSKKFESDLGVFYRVRTMDGKVGFMADNEILSKTAQINAVKAQKKTVNPKAPSPKAAKEKKENDPWKEDTEEPWAKEFIFKRYVGLSTSRIGFREDTMGLTPSAQLQFFGLKMSGSNVLVSGPLPSEWNLQGYFSAPSYYQQATGNAASGMILLTDFSLLAPSPIRENLHSYFGYGLLVKYSNFRTQLNGQNYTLEDMALGLKLQLGLAVKVSSLALRGDIQYYWEKKSYFGLGLALQMPF